MRHSTSIIPQFFLTAPQECPYIKNQEERKLFTPVDLSNSSLINNTLSKQGFRRSQNVLYRPACSKCSACLSARISLENYIVSKSQKRIIRNNVNLTRNIIAPKATHEQYNLFSTYINSRHISGGMAGMDYFEYSSMIEETRVKSFLIEYRSEDNELLGACLTDILDDGLSMVYSFYDPSITKNSLGSYIILDHIKLSKEQNLNYVYLGYWVKGSPTMEYKANFSGLELFANNKWIPLRKLNAKIYNQSSSMIEPVSKQVLNIKLPS